jgi:hypothetical protein
VQNDTMLAVSVFRVHGVSECVCHIQHVTFGSLIVSVRTDKAFGVAALNTGEPRKSSLLQQHSRVDTQVGMHALEPAPSGVEHAQMHYARRLPHGNTKSFTKYSMGCTRTCRVWLAP